MFRTGKGWAMAMIASSTAVGGAMILASRLFAGTPYASAVKGGFECLWLLVFLGLVGLAPKGACEFGGKRRPS